MSARSYHKLLKVARTIADLKQQTDISRAELLEALSYRAFDRLLQYLHS
jgi:magnesium chelatase family protein